MTVKEVNQMENASTINERIALVFDSSGKNQTSIAQSINISQQMVSMICRGKANPSDRTIADICRVFNVDEVWLRTGKGEMYSVSAKSDAILITLASALGPTNTEQDRFLRAVAQIPREYIVPISQAALTIARAMYPELFAPDPATQPDSKTDPDGVPQDNASPTGPIPPPG